MEAVTTNTVTLNITPQERPAEDVETDTTQRVTYWWMGPFTIEGPWDASGMEHAKSHFEKYRSGWWERKTTVTTTVTERL